MYSPFILLCCTGLFAIFSSTISKSPVLPIFTAYLGADPSGVGFIASVSAFTGVVMSIPAGILADRLGKRRMLVFSAIIFSTAFIADLSAAEGRGSAMGILGSIMDIGHTTGPLASGIIAAYFGISISFIGASLVLVVAAFIFWRSGIKMINYK